MNAPGYRSLTEIERAVFDWQYHLTGDFRTALWQAITRADEGNLQRLHEGFPNEVEGYLLFTRQSGWWDAVKKRGLIDDEK